MTGQAEFQQVEKPSPAAPSRVAEVISFIKTLVLLVAIAIMLRGTVIEAFKIPSGSMIPTLRIGDHILVGKLSYGLRLPFMASTVYDYAEPKRGDIVVFTRPDDPATQDEDDSSINIIKRVVGLPGEEVEVVGTKVIINGKPLEEPYAIWDEGGVKSWGPEKIPAGHVLLLGDNRDHSKDSRYWTDPFLDIKRIKGRAMIIYWTWDTSRFGRIGSILH